MRKSNKEAAQTREAIVAAAADHIRRTGIAEASLADVMAAAGLTHGGFYRHFRNKEHLVAEALGAAGDKIVAIISRKVAKSGRNAAVDSYLSASHRDSPTPICPFAALGSEMVRSGNETKIAATELLEKLFIALASDARPQASARRRHRGPIHNGRRHDAGACRVGQRSVSGNSGAREGAPAPIDQSVPMLGKLAAAETHKSRKLCGMPRLSFAPMSQWRSRSGQQHHLEITVCATARLHQADLFDADRFFSDVPTPDIRA